VFLIGRFLKIFSSETAGPNAIFQFIWESGFRGKDFLEINQSKTRMACGSHVLVGSIYGRSSLKIAHFVPIR
jgi:hypothetical protein